MKFKMKSWGKVNKRFLAICLAVIFVAVTAASTYVQATLNTSATVEIHGEPLVVKLKIHHYTLNPKFAIFHALLFVTNNYDDDIVVQHIIVESWSDPKGVTGSVMYGSDEASDIPIPAGETKVLRINEKCYDYWGLITDTDVYSYSYIAWTHGVNSYAKSYLTVTDATFWWALLYP